MKAPSIEQDRGAASATADEVKELIRKGKRRLSGHPFWLGQCGLHPTKSHLWFMAIPNRRMLPRVNKPWSKSQKWSFALEKTPDFKLDLV